MTSNKEGLLKQIPIDQLQRGRYQPREIFDPEALEELAQSIRSQGLILPLVVRPITSSRYEIIAGERRWRASQIAGLTSVSCLVRNFNDEQAAAVCTIENIQRQDLNPIEEAHAYARLVQEFSYHHDEVAAIVGKSRTQISNFLRLLKLHPDVQQLLMNQELSAGHGKMLAGLSESLQRELAKSCVEEGWSVRKIEEEIKKSSHKTASRKAPKDPNIARLERLVSDQLCSSVEVDQNSENSGGYLKIRFFDNETLAGLLERMGIKDE
jgi:ParB family chromosome partitioning protein